LATTEYKRCFRKNKPPRLLVFGYPSKSARVGGLLWSKRVSDSISKSGIFDIRNISTERSIHAKLNTRQIVRNIMPCLVKDFYDAVHGLLTLPDVALLDSWGEANIILWGLLRIFRSDTRIVTVFHHYEPRILPEHISRINCSFVKAIAKWYNSFIEKLTTDMIRDSDMILTVSGTSAKQICSLYGGTGRNHIATGEEKNAPFSIGKIRIVGIGVDRLIIPTSVQKDIDFFCIGRIEKLEGIDRIWSAVRKLRPEANFVMIGRASSSEIKRLRSIGINHKGQVSDEEKLQLYSRAKVFLFPSSREGFGIALAEALHLGMSAVIWRLPVFEELYSDSMLAKQGTIRLVERGNYESFTREALKALDLYEIRYRRISESSSSTSRTIPLTTESKKNNATTTISVLKLEEGEEEEKQEHTNESQTWQDVADKVVKVLSELL
jgi:glycosyltransferase involved in cell wall biosynthesis